MRCSFASYGGKADLPVPSPLAWTAQYATSMANRLSGSAVETKAIWLNRRGLSYILTHGNERGKGGEPLSIALQERKSTLERCDARGPLLAALPGTRFDRTVRAGWGGHGLSAFRSRQPFGVGRPLRRRDFTLVARDEDDPALCLIA
jgi:hypothetical protein